MELRTAIETRASVRAFTDDPISPDDLREMVRLAGRAPSPNNSQPWHFIAATNRELIREMAARVRQRIRAMIPDMPDEAKQKARSQVEWFSTFFENAPAVIAVTICPYQAVIDEALPGTGFTHDELNVMRGHPDIQSIGAAIQNLLLAATDMGYGACRLSGPLLARHELEGLLGIGSPWKLSALIALGKPSGSVTQRDRKPVEEIFEIRA